MISESDISIAHSLQRKKKNNKGSPSIIVRFTNLKARDAVYRARKSLKGLTSPVFINEDLTKTTADLYRRARDLRKFEKIFATWTAGGSLYIRQHEAATSKPIKISSESDLLGF